jgi:hypothetical protein
MDLAGNLLVGIAGSTLVTLTGAVRYSEILFPAIFAYHIATFMLTFPDASFFRKVLTTFCLSFADLACTLVVFQIPVPSKIWLWLLEFLVLIYMSYHISTHELKYYLNNDWIRLLMFVSAGYLKSVSLVSSLVMHAESSEITHLKTFLALFLLGMLKLGSAFLVYYFDLSLLKRRLDKQSIDDVWYRLKVTAVAVLIAIETCAYFNQDIKNNHYQLGRFLTAQDLLFCGSFPQIHLVSGAFMAGLYAFNSYSYGLELAEKLGD